MTHLIVGAGRKLSAGSYSARHPAHPPLDRACSGKRLHGHPACFFPGRVDAVSPQSLRILSSLAHRHSGYVHCLFGPFQLLTGSILTTFIELLPAEKQQNKPMHGSGRDGMAVCSARSLPEYVAAQFTE